MSKEKGSQFLLANYVNNQSDWLNAQILKSSIDLLNDINDELAIEWISPLKQHGYKEYRDNFLNVLGISGEILLVEAKAHLSEMKSELRATSTESINIIKKTFQQFRQKNGIDETYASSWENSYYQLANRLIYLDYLNHTLNTKTYLVLINFLDDSTNVRTSLQDYLSHYKKVFHEMGISHLKLLKYVILCYI